MVFFTLGNVGHTGAVDDNVGTVDINELCDFIDFGNINLVNIRRKKLIFHTLQQFQKGSTDVAFGTCNPYFFHRFSPVLDLYTEKL